MVSRLRNSAFPWGDFLKKTAAIAIPVAMQNLLISTGSMVDTIMISSLGNVEVGAVGLCAQYSSLMFSGIWGFLGGGTLFFSQFFGAEDDDGINRSYGMTLLCVMTVSLLFCLMATVFPETVMQMYTDKPEIQAIGILYLRIAGFTYPLTALSMAMATLLRCTERVRIPLYGSLAAVGVNIFLNWVLIFGNLGAPALGVRGAALATVIAQGVSVSTILILGRISGHRYLLAFREHFRISADFIRIYLRKCAPIIANELLIGVGNMVINIVLGRQPVEAIAALAVFRTLEGLVIGFFAGFSSAASVLVGTEVGAGKIEVAYQRGIRMVYLCQAFIACLGLLLIALHTPILTLMGMEGESFRIAFGLILIYCAAVVIRMGNWTHNDTFRSAGDAAFGTILEIAFMWGLLIPLVWLAGMVWHWPTLVIFACCYVDEPIRYVMEQTHLYRGKWIKPVTPEGIAGLAKWKAERGK